MPQFVHLFDSTGLDGWEETESRVSGGGSSCSSSKGCQWDDGSDDVSAAAAKKKKFSEKGSCRSVWVI
jgi:hypothetical protein